MESRRNKKIFNTIMVAVIAVIAIGGVMSVGFIKGWFSDGGEQAALAGKVTGVVNIERKGVSFELEEGAALQTGDKISTNEKAGIVIESGDNTYELAENTSVVVGEYKDQKFSMEITAGEAFAVLNDGQMFGNITAQERSITADGTVFSVNVQTGSMGVNVFEGNVDAQKGDKEVQAEEGQTISVVGEEMTVMELQASSLNQFNIEKALLSGEKHELCFSQEELNKVLGDRESEGTQAREEAESSESSQGTGNAAGKNPAQSGSSQSNGGSSSGGSGSGGSGSSASYDYTCTIEIRCDTILNNMGQLSPGKEGYVPSGGVILRTVTVGFNKGETVFDVLSRTCKEKGIQLEYSYTPMYGSYYIEGINNLYEFDCGNQSGWMYKVNGWFPNYGCSSYNLKDGDSIVWAFTCNGLGADLGASMG